MKINKHIASEITKKVMNVIPYNVNIMDDSGFIISSGDSSRIGFHHQGASTAIKEAKTVAVFSTDQGAKPGVNMPIQFKSKTIGVIGISGNPDIVMPFAELVKITAELLINQEFSFNERRLKEQAKEEFLYHWIFRTEAYDEAFLTSSEGVGIDLTMPRKAIVIKGKVKREPFLEEDEYTFKLSNEMTLFIVPVKSTLLKRLSSYSCTPDVIVGIGESYPHIHQSIYEAKKAIEFSEILQFPQNICHYSKIKFIDYLTNRNIKFDNLQNHFLEMESNPKGIELIETLVHFILYNGDMNMTSQKLHIHRNSLAYRLQKIETITGKNPKVITDLFQLFAGYIHYKMGAKS